MREAPWHGTDSVTELSARSKAHQCLHAPLIQGNSLQRNEAGGLAPGVYRPSPDPIVKPVAQVPSIPGADLADLKKKSIRGGAVTALAQGITSAIQLASTVVLARLLQPSDYGVIAMVVAITSFAGLFRDLGLSSAAIQKPSLTNAEQSNLFWINLGLGCTLTIILIAASPLVARFYQRSEVQWVTVALSTSFVIGSLATQSGALLVREMRYGRQAVGSIFGALVSLLVSVILAFKGFRYWSLVWGQLFGAAATSVLLLILSPFRPGLPSRGTGLRATLKFGANITAYDFVNYFARNLDNILIGRFWGAGPLGLYSRAYALLMFPINNLRAPLNAVAFPAMSRLQNQPAAYQAYYRRITLLLALLSMPLSAFLCVATRSIIAIALGPQWAGVGPIFTILAAVSFVQPVVTLWGMVTISSGMTSRYLRLGILNTLGTVVAFVVGLPWGPVGVATAYAIATYALAWPTLVWAFRGTPVSTLDFTSSVEMPALASIISMLACLFISPIFASRSTFPQILIESCVFGITYLTVLAAIPQGRRDLRHVQNVFAHIPSKQRERVPF